MEESEWECMDIDRVKISSEQVSLFFKDEYVCCPTKLFLTKDELIKICETMGLKVQK